MQLAKIFAPAVAIFISLAPHKIFAIKRLRSFIVLAAAIILLGTALAPAYSVLTQARNRFAMERPNRAHAPKALPASD